MKCSGCGHDNRDAAKFCEECAAPLGRKCAGCGAELRPVAKFCDECATPVTGAPPRSADPRSYTPKHLAEKIRTSHAAPPGARLGQEQQRVAPQGVARRGGREISSNIASDQPSARWRRTFPLR